MAPTLPSLRQILVVQAHRPIMTVVFAAVRGSASIRSSSGALIVTGATQITGTTSSVFVFPQDRVEILFSGAAFSGPFAGFALCRDRKSDYRRFRRRTGYVSVWINGVAARGGPA